jgi:hypothetical protein
VNKIKGFSPVLAIVGVLTVVGLSGCATAGAAATMIPAVQPLAVSSEPAATSGNVIVTNQNTGIWVSGQGTVSVVPDVASLSMGVQLQAATVSEALAQAAQSANSVISALKAKGVSDQDIQTQGYNISPVYGQGAIIMPPGTATPATGANQATGVPEKPSVIYPNQSVIIGYQVTNTLSITIRNLNNAGAIIDAAAQAGGNNIRVQGISFLVSDPAKYYTQARTLAVSDAKAKAQQLATTAGVTLGAVTYISENQSYYSPVYYSGAAVSGMSTPISPGQNQISISVQMVFAIQ